MARFFIHRPVFAIVLSLVILIAGALSIPSLPISQYPSITPPMVTVTAFYQGASAQVIEETVAAPIEQQVNGAEGMISMRSLSSNSGTYQLQVTFDVSRDQGLAMVDVQNRVNQASALLPSDVVQGGIQVKKQSTQAVCYISLYSPDESRDPLFLSNYATLNLLDRLARVPGVGLAQIAAGQRDYAMRLWVNPDRLARLGVTAEDIAGAVRSQSVQAPAGSLGAPPQAPGSQFQVPVQVKGRLSTPEEFGRVVIRTEPNGSFLRVRDVAATELGAQQYSSSGRRSGKPAVIMVIYQQPGANALSLAEAVRSQLDELSQDFPDGVAYELTYDNTLFVTDSIDEVVKTLGEAIVLVLLVVFVFLGNLRATLIPMLAVPVSLVGTFAGFAAAGFSINLLTLFGLVLAVGIVVDDAIVVVEAVEHHIEHGLSPLEATERAMEEVSGPVVAIALVLCAVFVPVAFMGGITGEMYRQFGVTLAISVLLSALVALTLTPALCRLLLRPRAPMRGPLGWLLGGFNRAFDAATAGYTWVVRRAIRSALLSLALLGGVYYGVWDLGGRLPSGFIPIEDTGVLMVGVSLPSGASLERTTRVANALEEALLKKPEVANTLNLVGFDMIQGTNTSNVAAIVAVLKPFEERQRPEEQVFALIPALQRELSELPEATVQVFVPPPIPGLGATGGVGLQLQDRAGQTPEALEEAADGFLARLRESPRVRGAFTLFATDYPIQRVDLDRDKALSMGIPVNQVFSALQIHLGGMFLNQFNQFGRTWRVYLQADSRSRRDPEDIGRLHVRSAQGAMVPLSTLVQLHRISGPDSLVRYNLYRTAEINASGRLGVSSGQVMDLMEEEARRLPPGFAFEWTGLAYQEKLSSGQQGVILGLGLLFVFLFLAAQYESWSVPFAVLLGLPTCVLGALVGCAVIRMDVNIYVQIGVLMLIGLASKNAILIVEFAKMKAEEGMPLVEAAVEGARLRFRPILMTSFAFLLGVWPLVVANGASAVSRRALGTAVFAGMSAAVVVGLLLIPALYVYVERVGGLFRRRPVQGPEAPVEAPQAIAPAAPPEPQDPEVAPAPAVPAAPPEVPPAGPVPDEPGPAGPAEGAGSG